MNWFTLAGRNLFRKRRRLIVTVGAMGLAGGLIIFYNALVAGMSDSMLLNMVDNGTGHVQIHAPGYREDPDLYTTLSDTEKTLKAIRDLGYTATPRAYAGGLVAMEETSAGAQLWAVDVASESTVTKLPSLIAQGEWLDPADPYGAVLGSKLAKKLGAKPGSELVVLGQGADGSMANELLTVRGVLSGASALVDETGVLLPAPTFREIFVTGPEAHQIIVRGEGLSPDLEKIKTQVAELVPEAEVKTWIELNPVVATMNDSMDVGIYVMLTIAYLAVGMVVFNAMLMSVFERIREFGILKALGVRPASVFFVITIEAAAEAVLASVMALLIGLPPALFYARHGMDLSSMMPDSVSYMGMNFEPIWYAAVETKTWAVPVAALFVLTALAVLYPALKAARLSPVKAIYHR